MKLVLRRRLALSGDVSQMRATGASVPRAALTPPPRISLEKSVENRASEMKRVATPADQRTITSPPSSQPRDEGPKAETTKKPMKNKQNREDRLDASALSPSQHWQGAGLSTGFPLPTGYAESKKRPQGKADGYDFFTSGRRLRSLREKRTALARARTTGSTAKAIDAVGAVDKDKPFRPHYRISSALAELQRHRERSRTARILIVDEGGEFRAVFATAVLRLMLSKLRKPLDVCVECASIGPPSSPTAKDPRFQKIAAEMGIPLTHSSLLQLQSKAFRSVDDAVRYDMIIVLDRFDYQEMLREISALDAAHRGGCYAGRLRLLRPFGRTIYLQSHRQRRQEKVSNSKRRKREDKSCIVEDIADPMYGFYPDGESEINALRTTAKEIAASCRGLISYFVALKDRCHGSIGVRDSLAISLRCPLLSSGLPASSSWHDAKGINTFAFNRYRHLPTYSGCDTKEEAYTVRAVRGKRTIVKRPIRPRGYWKNPQNVALELRKLITEKGLDRLPTQAELRRGGASSLSSAIDAHGGLALFADILGMDLSVRKPNGYWEDFDNLAKEVKPYLVGAKVAASDGPTDLKIVKEDALSRVSQGLPKLYMPTQKQLIDAGRSDLIRAIRQHGGSSAVAERLGVSVKRGQGRTVRDVWKDLVRFVRGVDLEDGGSKQVSMESESDYDNDEEALCIVGLPTRQELLSGGRGDLVAALDRLGGFPLFRKYLEEICADEEAWWSMEESSMVTYYRGHRNGATCKPATLPSQFVSPNVDGWRGDVPGRVSNFSKVFIHNEGESIHRTDVVGGAVSQFDVPQRERALPVLERVAADVAAWMRVHRHGTIVCTDRNSCQDRIDNFDASKNKSNRAPTKAELLASDREDLWKAVQRIGGMKRIAEHLGLEWIETRGRKPSRSKMSSEYLKNEDVDKAEKNTLSMNERSPSTSVVDSISLREDIEILEAYEDFMFV